MPYVLGHVYLAMRLNKESQFILGNIFPDISHLINKETHAKMLKFAEIYTKVNGNEAFYEGVKNHFRVDAYMHPSFVYKKMRLLKEEFNDIDDMLAHGLVEATLDVEVRKKYPWVSDVLKKALKNFDRDGIPIYLADFLHENRNKIRTILNDLQNKSQEFSDKSATFAQTIENQLGIAVASLQAVVTATCVKNIYCSRRLKG